ncbi:DUF3781 domain-containing protein [Oceanotoga sp. DSM 15011]|nr:DUF3781 domain-containing protein [Oceanotoga sp. DSM 15011]UYP00344.1 DUF3781 domain-containing protein [Oceanotoga sp. DSM 15011]
MEKYTTEELTEALRAINSIIHKCEKAQEKFPKCKSQHTLLKNQLKAMYISKALITEALSKIEPDTETKNIFDDSCSSELLLSNLDQLHTTNLGAERIRKNLRLDTDDVVDWCRGIIKAANANITRKGKNWYIAVNDCKITVNAHSYTVITAHRLA